jgi:hypothetical protein
MRRPGNSIRYAAVTAPLGPKAEAEIKRELRKLET